MSCLLFGRIIMAKNKKRIWYLDYLRILAIWGVITIHVVTSLNYYKLKKSSFDWQVLNFWDGLSRFCVPIFIMISGSLFLNPNFELSFKKLFSKYLSKLLGVYIFWQLFYCTWYSLVKGGDLVTFFKLLIGSYDHLWYLPMIMGLYLVTPLLRQITKRESYTEYFLGLAFIFAVLLPTSLKFISVISSSLPKHTMDAVNAVNRLLGKLNIKIVMGYTGYYVAGFYFSHSNLQKRHLMIVEILGALGGIGTVLLSSYLTVKTGHLQLMFYSYNSLTVMLESCAIFIYFVQKKFIPKNRLLLKEVSNSVFGIYLLHPFILYYLLKLPLIAGLAVYTEFLPIVSLIVLIITLVVVLGLRKIPFIRKHLM